MLIQIGCQTSNTLTVNDNISNALGERVDELSAEQMQVDQEDGVANLLLARNQPRQSNVPTSTSSQDTVMPPNDHKHDASPPQTRYFVEEEDLKRPEVRLLETLNGRTVSIF